MRPILLAALALVALPLAGCAEEGGDADTQSTTGTSGTPTRTGTGGSFTTTMTGSGGNQTGPSGNATGNGTGNATGNATGNGTGNGTWEYDNRTGTVAGTGIPVFSASFEETETVQVANGTLNLTLNLTSTGDDVTVTVQPPGCEEDDCTVEVEAEGGRADFAYGDPAEGEWSVTMSVSGTGPVEAEYELTVAQLVPGNATA